jgi:hypothetical protein
METSATMADLYAVEKKCRQVREGEHQDTSMRICTYDTGQQRDGKVGFVSPHSISLTERTFRVIQCSPPSGRERFMLSGSRGAVLDRENGGQPRTVVDYRPSPSCQP